jgi:hypothetical protein
MLPAFRVLVGGTGIEREMVNAVKDIEQPLRGSPFEFQFPHVYNSLEELKRGKAFPLPTARLRRSSGAPFS